MCKIPTSLSGDNYSNEFKDIKQLRKHPDQIVRIYRHHAQILANVNNLQKVLLYLKINMEYAEKCFREIKDCASVKLRIYRQKGTLNSVSKLKARNNDQIALLIDKLTEIDIAFYNELKKLSSFIFDMPTQFKTSKYTFCPIKDLFGLNVGEKSLLDKLKNIYSNSRKVSGLIRILAEQKNSQKYIKLIIKKIKEKDILEPSSESLVSLRRLSTLKQTSTAASLDFYRRIYNNILYKLFHMKSSILKKLQLYTVMQSLTIARNQLTIHMKKYIKDRGNDISN